jgi:hypothetical protein
LENKLHKINDCNSYYKIKAATSRLLVKQLYPKKFNFQNISDIYTYSDELYFYLWIFFGMRTVINICDFFKGWWSVLKFYLPTKTNQKMGKQRRSSDSSAINPDRRTLSEILLGVGSNVVYFFTPTVVAHILAL